MSNSHDSKVFAVLATKPSTIFAAALVATLAGPAPAAADVVHDYTVAVDEKLTELRVEARFLKPVTSVSARSQGAGRLLLDVQDCDRQERLRMRNRRMMLPAGGIRCINYRVDLVQAAREERSNRYLSAENLLVSPSSWLWRPELKGQTELRVRFRLPDGVGLAVPWEPVEGSRNTYLVKPSPESGDAPALFGSFGYHELPVRGATLRVALPRSEPPLYGERILDWVRATATDVSLAYGRFPGRSPFVIVIPVGGGRPSGGSAVPFGRVIRDGGAAIELFVDQRKPIDEYLSDWTATHEFSHLMLPYLNRQHRWVSEGFAQYYQNVLLARSGAYDRKQAWRKIHAGLARGRASRPELSPNEAAATNVLGGRMKIYWAGAAIALMADVQLRERSAGAESLDDVLGRLEACCLPSADVWSAPELFARLDSLIEDPVFMPLYRRYANTAGFPDATEYFERLGVQIDGEDVRFRRNAELAEVREAITRSDPATARWRQALTAD